MFDGIKIIYNDSVLAKKLPENERMMFLEHSNMITGEIARQTGELNGLKVTTFPSGRIEVKGSLHKFYNGGLHNHDNYTLDKLAKTVDMIEKELGFDPRSASVQNLEFGVNICTPFCPNSLLDSLISYKYKPFNTMQVHNPGYGKECFLLQQYGVKIYNKGLQYDVGHNLLRIEKKIRVMCSLKFGKLFLSDLTKPELWNHCKNQLVQMIDDTLVNEDVRFEHLTKTEKRIYHSIIDQRIRLKLNKEQRKRYKKGFNAIIAKYGMANYRKIIKNLITVKCEELVQ